VNGERASDERHPVTGTSASGPAPAQELTEALAEVRAGRRDAYERVVDSTIDGRSTRGWRPSPSDWRRIVGSGSVATVSWHNAMGPPHQRMG